MDEISTTSSQEQRTGIEQVNMAVSQMDQVTQQNAALVEEASAAAHSMAAQGRHCLTRWPSSGSATRSALPARALRWP
ncbi:hypothetical protein [Pararobbsia alpina]|uniref:Methyl-accepting transducer domain-containing protein n=1 Tax=Pararobbsia alpina TaxID=621374 RepID=A0A6S7D6C4_9BURK|nr:hypothetical protein LMG28138_06032 [Pararobbsia alpina]